MPEFYDDTDNNAFDANYNFSFLDNYISRIKDKAINADQQLSGDNEFFETDDVEEAQETAPEEQALAEEGTTSEDELFNDLMEDDPSTDWPFLVPPAFSTSTSTTTSGNALKDQLSALESGGNYGATNPNSSATGKYQFLWSAWGDSIKKVTGVKSQQEFLKSPAAQEKYYAFYEKSHLMPQVEKIRKELKPNLTDTQLAKLVHFRGEVGARKYLRGEVSDKPEAYNIPTSKYIRQVGGTIPNAGSPYDILNYYETTESSLRSAKRAKINKSGRFKAVIPMDSWTDDLMNYVDKIKFIRRSGKPYIKVRGKLPVAETPQQQQAGLNDESIDELMLPLQGKNIIRGLDSGEPVSVVDQDGIESVLYGPEDIVYANGNVREKRLKYGKKV